MRKSLALALVTASAAASAGAAPPPASLSEEAMAPMVALSKSTAELARYARQGLVFISVEKAQPTGIRPDGLPFEFGFRGPNGPQGPAAGLGSGFLVDVERGLIVTNNHVVEGASRLEVKLANGDTRSARIVGRDPRTDIAVVAVKDRSFDKTDLTALSFGDSDKLEVGHFVAALGAPFGLEASLTAGVVSAVKRGNLDIAQLGDFVQTDAAINPGMSGGPLLDSAGRVVGVNTAIFSRSGASDGIGFAVPSNIAKMVADRLIEDGRIARGYLGLSLSDAKDKGAHIAGVEPKGPAASAGFEEGDLVVKANDKDVRSAAELTNLVGLMAPGTKVKFTVKRGSKDRELDATIGTWPEHAEFAARGR